MDGGATLSAVPAEPSSRSERLPLLAFIADADTEAVLREGLVQALPSGCEIRRGNVRTALTALSSMPTPRALVIDITGEAQPLALLSDLTHVVEPDVQVMIVGDRQDVAFYRQVTQTLGATEYLYKPLMPEMVARHFGARVLRQAPAAAPLGGRMVTVTGVRGGVGATTVATNLAWHLAQTSRRHTVLLDADLQTGSAAMLLGAQTGPGLRSAIEQPNRLDELFVERAAIPVADRLYVIAGEEPLTEQPGCTPGAVALLASLLRRRFNFVVADVPFASGLLSRDLLEVTQQRVLVMLPTLSSVRDTLRLLALPPGPAQARRAVLVLNRAGMPGGLSRRDVQDALQMTVDVTIGDLPRPVAAAENMGEPAAQHRGAFRTGIAELAQEVSFAPVAGRKRRWWQRR